MDHHHKEPLKLSEKRFSLYVSKKDGYCSKCNKIIKGVFISPKLDECRCPNCCTDNMMGIEVAVIQKHIQMVR